MVRQETGNYIKAVCGALKGSDAPMAAPFAGYKGASDWFIDSNIQLALAASKMVSTQAHGI